MGCGNLLSRPNSNRRLETTVCRPLAFCTKNERALNRRNITTHITQGIIFEMFLRQRAAYPKTQCTTYVPNMLIYAFCCDCAQSLYAVPCVLLRVLSSRSHKGTLWCGDPRREAIRIREWRPTEQRTKMCHVWAACLERNSEKNDQHTVAMRQHAFLAEGYMG